MGFSRFFGFSSSIVLGGQKTKAFGGCLFRFSSSFSAVAGFEELFGENKMAAEGNSSKPGLKRVVFFF